MRIAVAEKMQYRRGVRVRALIALDPDLANAAPNLVRLVPRRFRHWFKRTPEFDHIAVAVFPIIEEREIIADDVNFGQVSAPSFGLTHL